MTTIQTIKRFFEPIKSRTILLKSIFIGGLYAFNGIYNVIILKDITRAIEQRNLALFEYKFMQFIVVISMFYIMSFFLRRWWAWVATYYENMKQAHRDYMNRFVLLDNNAIEGIWTGRLISIIDKGFTSWSNLITTSIEKGTKVIITIIFASYMILQANVWYFLWFVVIFLGILKIVSLVNTWIIGHRKFRIEAMNGYSHQLVKMIMSKFEILQNHKTANEIIVLDGYIDTAQYHNLGINTGIFWIFNIPRIFIFLLKTGIYGIIGYGIFRNEFTIADLVWFVVLLNLLEATIVEFVDFFKGFTQ